MSIFKLSFPASNGGQFQKEINTGAILFIVGANGTGKSILMQRFATQNPNNVRRITAHRQVWFNSNTVEITPTTREQNENQMRNQDQQPASRYLDQYGALRSQAMIFDLIDSENVEARKIAEAARSGHTEVLKDLISQQSPLSKLNEILKLSNLDIQINVEKGSKLFAEREGSVKYSIAELSDGERNAILIIANVLTAPTDALFLIDEPERHLHRSIVSPLLSTLLTQRSDCAFVVSTHDISLPIDQKKSSCLLLRKYTNSPQQWFADYIEAVEELDEFTASAILGAREKILFVEGNSSSLDIQIFQLLFPNVSIKPLGSCVEVIRAVQGIRSVDGHHWIKSFGIIDRDNRSEDECQKLIEKGIVPLDQYSVESLYYHPNTFQGVLERVSKINGLDIQQTLISITDGVVNSINGHKDRMALRIVERRIKDKILNESPSWKDLARGETEIKISTKDFVHHEKHLINEMLKHKDVAGLISRYPVRETPALESISKSLGFLSKESYEQAVRKMLCDSEVAKQKLRDLIRPISELL